VDDGGTCGYVKIQEIANESSFSGVVVINKTNLNSV